MGSFHKLGTDFSFLCQKTITQIMGWKRLLWENRKLDGYDYVVMADFGIDTE